MTTNNILPFPKEKIVREAINDVEEVKKAQEKSLRNYADTVINDLVNVLASEINIQGLNLEDENFVRDFDFALAVLSAAVYRSLKVPHDLHSFLDECVKTAEILMRDEDELDLPK